MSTSNSVIVCANDADSKRSLEEIVTENINQKCVLCNRSSIDELNLGILYKRNGVISHYFCLLFCSNLKQRGKDDEGILGFLTCDIEKEVTRVRANRKHLAFYKCKFCKCSGATIGCCVASCKFIYHFPCGLANAANFRFRSKFESYCEKHTRLSMVRQVKPERHNCCICSNTFTSEDNDKRRLIFGSCCQRLFHKDCIQKYALTAGYMFKCPACAVKEAFKYDVQMQGIYVPDRDALWELESQAFNELQQLHSSCDAESCKCPTGRSWTDKEKGSPWYLLRCSYCAAAGMHIECGSSSAEMEKWICRSCLEVETRLNDCRAKRSKSIIISTDNEDDSSVVSVLSSSSSSVFSPIKRQHKRDVSPLSSSVSSSGTLFSLIRSPTLSTLPPSSRCAPPKGGGEDSDSSSDKSSLFTPINRATLKNSRVKCIVSSSSSESDNDSKVIDSTCKFPKYHSGEDFDSSSDKSSLFIPINRATLKNSRVKCIVSSSSSESDNDSKVIDSTCKFPKYHSGEDFDSSSVKSSLFIPINRATLKNSRVKCVVSSSSESDNDNKVIDSTCPKYSGEDSVQSESKCHWTKKRRVVKSVSTPSSPSSMSPASNCSTSVKPTFPSLLSPLKQVKATPTKKIEVKRNQKENVITIDSDNGEEDGPVNTKHDYSSSDDSIFQSKCPWKKKRRVVNSVGTPSPPSLSMTSNRSTMVNPSPTFLGMFSLSPLKKVKETPTKKIEVKRNQKEKVITIDSDSDEKGGHDYSSDDDDSIFVSKCPWKNRSATSPTPSASELRRSSRLSAKDLFIIDID